MNNVHRNLIRPHSFMSAEKDLPNFNGNIPLPPFFQNFMPPFPQNNNLNYFSIPPPPSLLFKSSDMYNSINSKKSPFTSDSGLIQSPSSDIMKISQTTHPSSVLSKIPGNFFPFPSLSNSPFLGQLTLSAFSSGNYKRFSGYDPSQSVQNAAFASKHMESVIQKLSEASNDFQDPFQKGRLIKMSDGELKVVESLSASDFEKSCKSHNGMVLVPSEVKLIEVSHSDNTARIQLIHENRSSVIVVSVSKPFFIRDAGWAAIDPDACLNKYSLHATKLQLNDVCFCLVKKKLLVDENKSLLNTSFLKRPLSEKLNKKSRYQPY